MSGGEINFDKLNDIEWNNNTVEKFQEAVDGSTQHLFCGGSGVSKKRLL